jgi:conjugal transfer pilus assembly protein TraW
MRCSEYLCQPRRRPGRMALVAAALLLSLAVRAQDLGVIGPVYPIAEPSLLEVILARLRDAEATGVLARLQQDAQARAKKQIEQPASIVKLTKTTKARSFYYDPSIVVPYAIHDADGKLDRRRQERRVNPLDTVSLSQALLFIDARDSAQVKRASGILDERGGQTEGDSDRRLLPRSDAPMEAAGVLRPAGNAHRQARHPPRAGTRFAGRQEAEDTHSGMNSCKRLVAVPSAVAGLALARPAAAGPTCHGRFMNPITDICWSCVFPAHDRIRVAGQRRAGRHRQSIQPDLLSAAIRRASAYRSGSGNRCAWSM